MTPETLDLSLNEQQEVSFASEIDYTDVHLFVDQFDGSGESKTAEFPFVPGQGGFMWTFSVVWPMFTEFLPGDAVVRFTGMDDGSEFITTCGVHLQ